MSKKIIKVNIKNVSAGDVILIDGIEHTVSRTDIKYSSFMGKSIKGNTYNLGYKLVDKVIY